MSTRRTFTEPSIQENFERDGYVILPWISVETVNALRQQYEELGHHRRKGFHATMFHESTDYRQRVYEIVQPVLSETAPKYFKNHKPLTGQFAVKEPGLESFLNYHLDWSFLDERTSSSVSIWCPLQPVNGMNGYLWVLPGSHLLPFTIRGFGYIHTQCPTDEVLKRRFKRLALIPELGHAVVYDHRLIHGSPANLSEETRVVAALVMLPEESQSLYYHRKGNSEIEIIETDSFFYSRFCITENPKGIRKLGKIRVAPNYIKPSEMALFVDRKN